MIFGVEIKKCFKCSSSKDLVSVIVVVDPIYTCKECYYCKAVLKSGKNKGQQCQERKGTMSDYCKRHAKSKE